MCKKERKTTNHTKEEEKKKNPAFLGHTSCDKCYFFSLFWICMLVSIDSSLPLSFAKRFLVVLILPVNFSSFYPCPEGKRHNPITRFFFRAVAHIGPINTTKTYGWCDACTYEGGTHSRTMNNVYVSNIFECTKKYFTYILQYTVPIEEKMPF